VASPELSEVLVRQRHPESARSATLRKARTAGWPAPVTRVGYRPPAAQVVAVAVRQARPGEQWQVVDDRPDLPQVQPRGTGRGRRVGRWSIRSSGPSLGRPARGARGRPERSYLTSPAEPSNLGPSTAAVPPQDAPDGYGRHPEGDMTDARNDRSRKWARRALPATPLAVTQNVPGRHGSRTNDRPARASVSRRARSPSRS
jgi:hypothetical protein